MKMEVDQAQHQQKTSTASRDGTRSKQPQTLETNNNTSDEEKRWNVQVLRGELNTKCLNSACTAIFVGCLLLIIGAGLATLGFYTSFFPKGSSSAGNGTYSQSKTIDQLTYERIRSNNSTWPNVFAFVPPGSDLDGDQISLNYMTYAGPIIMGIGGFIIVAACVITLEARDSASKVAPTTVFSPMGINGDAHQGRWKNSKECRIDVADEPDAEEEEDDDEDDSNESQTSEDLPNDARFKAYLKRMQYGADGGINQHMLSDALGKIAGDRGLRRSLSAADIELIDKKFDGEEDEIKTKSSKNSKRPQLKRQAMSMEPGAQHRHELHLKPGTELVGPVAVVTSPSMHAPGRTTIITPYKDVANLRSKISDVFANRSIENPGGTPKSHYIYLMKLSGGSSQDSQGLGSVTSVSVRDMSMEAKKKPSSSSSVVSAIVERDSTGGRRVGDEQTVTTVREFRQRSPKANLYSASRGIRSETAKRHVFARQQRIEDAVDLEANVPEASDEDLQVEN